MLSAAGVSRNDRGDLAINATYGRQGIGRGVTWSVDSPASLPSPAPVPTRLQEPARGFAMARISVLFLIFAVLLVTATDARAERVLRLTMQLPPTNIVGQNAQTFKELVENRSNGLIRVEIFPSARLYKDSEVPQAVTGGAIDMGIASSPAFPAPDRRSTCSRCRFRSMTSPRSPGRSRPAIRSVKS